MGEQIQRRWFSSRTKPCFFRCPQSKPGLGHSASVTSDRFIKRNRGDSKRNETKHAAFSQWRKTLCVNLVRQTPGRPFTSCDVRASLSSAHSLRVTSHMRKSLCSSTCEKNMQTQVKVQLPAGG